MDAGYWRFIIQIRNIQWPLFSQLYTGLKANKNIHTVKSRPFPQRGGYFCCKVYVTSLKSQHYSFWHNNIYTYQLQTYTNISQMQFFITLKLYRNNETKHGIVSINPGTFHMGLCVWNMKKAWHRVRRFPCHRIRSHVTFRISWLYL